MFGSRAVWQVEQATFNFSPCMLVKPISNRGGPLGRRIVTPWYTLAVDSLAALGSPSLEIGTVDFWEVNLSIVWTQKNEMLKIITPITQLVTVAIRLIPERIRLCGLVRLANCLSKVRILPIGNCGYL